jgi:hypothetical protein
MSTETYDCFHNISPSALLCFTFCFFPSVAQQPKSGLGRLVEVSRTHTIRHTHQVELLWTNDQLVVEATTCTGHNTKQKTRTYISSAGFEPAIPTIKRVHPYHILLYGDIIHKSWTMRWAGHVARMGENTNAYRGKSYGKKHLKTFPGLRWHNIRIYI